MSKQVITLSDRAATRVKEIIANAKEPIVGVRVGVASGGCAGMSYVMEYANEGKWREIEKFIFNFQQTCKRLKYSEFPVISAP